MYDSLTCLAQLHGLDHRCGEPEVKKELATHTLFTPASLIAVAQYAPFSGSANELTWENLKKLAHAHRLSITPASTILQSLQLDLDGFVFATANEQDEGLAEWALCNRSVSPRWS